MSQENLKQQTIKGVLWSFIDSVGSQGITFIVGLVLARILSPEEYGLIGIILIFVSIFNCIVNSGFSSALIRKKDATDADYNTVFITNLVISIVLSLVLFLSAPLIASFFNQPRLESLTRVLSSIVVINALGIVQNVKITKRIDFKTHTKISIIASSISGILGIMMAVSGYGVWALVGQQIAKQLLNTIFLWIYNKWIPQFQFSVESFKNLFSFGWKLLVSSLIDVIWRDIYQIIIGKCYSPATLGQYSQANQYTSIFSSNLTAVVQRVSYPVLSKIQDDLPRMKQAYRRIIKITMFVTFVLMLGLASIAKPLILVLVGEKWLIAASFLPILSLRMMLYPLHALNLNMLQVLGRSDLFLKLEIIKKIVSIIPLLLGIFIDIYWMLWASVIDGIIAYFLNSFYSGKFLNYSTFAQLKDISKSFGIAAIMAIIVFLISLLPLSIYIMLPLQILIGVCITIILSEYFKIEEYYEIKSILLRFINKHNDE